MPLEYLDNIGRTKQAFKLEPDSPFQQILKAFAEDKITKAKTALVNGEPSHNATGALAQSIGFQIDFGDVITIDFLMNDYWDFINSGVNGVERQVGATPNAEGIVQSFKSINPSPKMIDAMTGEAGGLDGWIRAKNITALIYINQDGQQIVNELVTDEDFKAAAFVFARGVKKRGIEPNHFIDDVFTEEELDDLEQKLLDEIDKLL